MEATARAAWELAGAAATVAAERGVAVKAAAVKVVVMVRAPQAVCREVEGSVAARVAVVAVAATARAASSVAGETAGAGQAAATVSAIREEAATAQAASEPEVVDRKEGVPRAREAE